jgi:Mrp family chromosome partitioning ATPase
VRADRYRTAEEGDDPGRVLLAPLLGEIPDLGAKRPRAGLSEMPWEPVNSYQLVASTLRSAMRAGVLLMSSTSPEGRSSVVAANLAAAAARDGRRVVVVDADNRGRTLSKLAGAQSRAGLTELVTGSADVATAVAHVRLRDPHVFDLVPAGEAIEDVASLYRSEGMTALVHRLRGGYDLIIFDGPPLLAAPETSSLVAHADGIVVIVGKGTRVHLLHRIRQHLELFSTPLLGYVFTSGRDGDAAAERAEAAPKVEVEVS